MDFNKAALEMHETHHGKVGIVSKVEVRPAMTCPPPTPPVLPNPAARSKRIPTTCTSTPSRAIWWPSSPMARLCWGWATSAQRPVCRSWRARLCSSRSSAAWTLPHLHRRPRRGQRHRGLQGHRPHLRRHQPRGHQEPECFEIEETLERELDIPVFHDDQHGTAIVVTAASSTPCVWWARRWRTSTSS